MYDLVTFGETMLCLVAPEYRRLEQATVLEVDVAGAELNVAVAAQRLGLKTTYVTRLPNNPLGRMIVNKAREHGVDTSYVVWTDEGRVGIHFAEMGASPRASSVLYDRRDSAIARIRPGEINWDEIFAKAKAFHITGITPALSSSAEEAAKEALYKALKYGAIVSIDLNYRAKLWSPEKARQVLAEFVSHADILISTEEDAERVFSVKEESFEKVAERLNQLFPNLKVVVITIRETPSVWRNTWTALAYSNGAVIKGPVFDIEVVGRLGAGDAFAGGFLYGYLTRDIENGLNYGVAISALKQTHPGPLAWVTKEECDNLLKGVQLRISR